MYTLWKSRINFPFSVNILENHQKFTVYFFQDNVIIYKELLGICYKVDDEMYDMLMYDILNLNIF